MSAQRWAQIANNRLTRTRPGLGVEGKDDKSSLVCMKIILIINIIFNYFHSKTKDDLLEHMILTRVVVKTNWIEKFPKNKESNSTYIALSNTTACQYP